MDEQSVFLAALERTTPSDRDAFLHEACGTDVALRERLESMLRCHETAANHFDRSPLKFFQDQQPTFDCPDLKKLLREILTPSDEPGCLGTLQQYQVQEVIGSGAMGVVLKAYEPSLSRMVAIKILGQSQSANPLAKKRFLREAKSAAAVIHPNVVTIHAVDEGPPPYLVMEFVSGRSLEAKIRLDGPLTVTEILRIGSQLAEGLATAHKQGLIHRDIKPANILLENGVERVKITDFGLARAINDNLNLSYAGSVSGTPPYMSPEQAKGAGVDHRSDLFSLGSVLYALCTGRPPFLAENWFAVMRQVIDDTPQPIIQLNPEIPFWLCEIISRLHEKDPANRYQSAAEVASLLESRLLQLRQPASVEFMPSAGPQASRESMASTRFQRLWQHRFGRATGLVAIVMLLGSLVFALTRGTSSGQFHANQTSDLRHNVAERSAIPSHANEFVPPEGTISRIVDDSDLTYVETQKEGTPEDLGWKSGSDFDLRERSYARSYRFNSAGALLAQWRFPELPPGEYDVLITWPNGPQYNGQASYMLYDDDVKIRRHDLKQGRKASEYPGSETYQGVVWVRLDTVRIESGTAVIELNSQLSKGTGIASDAVWVRTKQPTIR